jgi:iron complex outermembrane receptor protein
MKALFTVLVLLFLSTGSLMAQRQVTGQVVDADTGEPLVGASVQARGTTMGTQTDRDGNFTLTVPADATALRINYTGYESLEQPITDGAMAVRMTSGLLLTEDLVVVGTRNQSRTKLETPVPVDVIPVSAVASEVGQVDINQILTYVAPSFQSARQAIADGTDHVDPAQLRGLGPDQVLVLINGKRRHQSALVNVNGTVNRGTVGTDLAAIPASAIDRIEILRDGAAAQYGSDAIAGVINIVLKNRANVLDGSVSYGLYSTDYERNYALWKAGTVADPTVHVNDGETVQAGLNYGFRLGTRGFLNLTGEYISRGATNRAGTYTGQVYPRNGAGQIVDDSIFGTNGLTREFFDMRIGQSKMTGGGLMYNLDYGFGSSWSLYSFGGYNAKQGEAAGFYRYPSSIATGARNFASSVFALYPNGFLPLIQTGIQDASFALGLRGLWGSWNVDLSNTFGQNNFDFTVANSVNYTQAAESPNNLQTEFDAGGLTFRQNTVNLDLSRQYEAVLAGLNVAFGAEYRLDQFGLRAGEEASFRNYDTGSGAAAGAQVFSGFLPTNEGTNSRNCLGVYADFEQDFTESFMINLAGRFENYSDFGSTVNGKLASRLKLGDVVSVRGSVSTGFRAPSMQQRFYAKTNTLFVSQGGTLVPIESGTFTNDSEAARILGIPELKEETSLNYSIGATARFLRSFELTVDYYRIAIDDRIVLTNNFTAAGDSVLAAQLAAANAGAANFFTNAVDTRASGIEAVLSYGKRYFGGRHEVRFVLAGTFINNEVVKDDQGKPIVQASDVLIRTGQLNNYFNREDQSRIEVANPQAKVSGTLNYRVAGFGIMLRGVYFGPVEYLDPTINPAMPDNFPVNAFTNAKETLDQKFDPKTIWDVSLSYRFLRGLQLTVGANNVFDTYQDVHRHSGNVSLGRFVYSRRVQQFGFNGRYLFARLKFDLPTT